MNKKPSIDIAMDNNMKAELIIGCPQCKKKMRVPAKNVVDGKEFHCGCGFVAKISGNDFRELQKSLDDLKKTFDRLF